MSEVFGPDEVREQETCAQSKAPRLKTRRGYPCWLYLATDGAGLCKVGVSNYVPSRMIGIQQQYRLKFPGRHQSNLRPKPFRAWHFSSRNEAYCVEQLILWATRRHYAVGEWRWCEAAPLSVLISWVVKNLHRVKFTSNPNSSGFVTFNMQDRNVKLLHETIMKKGGVHLLSVSHSAGATI